MIKTDMIQNEKINQYILSNGVENTLDRNARLRGTFQRRKVAHHVARK